MGLYFYVAVLYSCIVELYSCVVILHWSVVEFYYCNVVLHSHYVSVKTNENAHRKGKCTFCILPIAFTRENTKRAFPFPLFANATKRINFPLLNRKNQNIENKIAQHITRVSQERG